LQGYPAYERLLAGVEGFFMVLTQRQREKTFNTLF